MKVGFVVNEESVEKLKDIIDQINTSHFILTLPIPNDVGEEEEQQICDLLDDVDDVVNLTSSDYDCLDGVTYLTLDIGEIKDYLESIEPSLDSTDTEEIHS